MDVLHLCTCSSVRSTWRAYFRHVEVRKNFFLSSRDAVPGLCVYFLSLSKIASRPPLQGRDVNQVFLWYHIIWLLPSIVCYYFFAAPFVVDDKSHLIVPITLLLSIPSLLSRTPSLPCFISFFFLSYSPLLTKPRAPALIHSFQHAPQLRHAVFEVMMSLSLISLG
ncbi:hypothetical protein BKA57DRAFT_91606 [Linnemannia elongata]|nr:hypothetical protein BKA57DRAFT_91606 [Linnemannia elongata]